jgi:PAS domain S-box-containing protein
MIWQDTPYTIPLLAATIMLIVSALYVWLRSLLPGAKPGALLLLAGTAWMVGFSVELLGADLATKVLGDKVQFSVMAAVPIVWLAYVLQFTGLERWVTRRNLVITSIVPGVLILLAFTNEYHGLIWSRVALEAREPSMILDKTHNVGYWIFLVYSYIVILAGSLQLVKTLVYSRRVYRQQIKTLVFAIFVPLLGGALYMYGVNPLLPFNVVWLAGGVIMLIMAWSIVRVKLENIAPVIRGTIIESMNDGVIVLDSQNCIMDINPSVQHMIGSTALKAIGKPIEKVWPGLADSVGLFNHENRGVKEIVQETGSGQRVYDTRISTLTDWRGRITNRVIVVRDITERKQAEDRIKASLKEKEVLLREIHHRVKNNLQIISSLLNLQSDYIEDKRDLEMIKESQDRVKSMALIHEKLYRSENLAEINSREYITELVQDLVRSYFAGGGIALVIEVDDFPLEIDAAIPCGLIINELVSNSLKHAFPDGKGKLTVRLRSVDRSAELIVCDDGVGIPEDVDFRNTESLGLRLVTILVEDQIGGEIRLDRSKGTAFYITFEKSTNRGQSPDGGKNKDI